MRLGQLARKLAIPPSEITDFLTTQGVPSVEGANARLSDEQLAMVLQRFAPEGFRDEMFQTDEPAIAEEIPVASVIAVQSVVEPDVVNETVVVVTESVTAVKVEDVAAKAVDAVETPNPEKPEVIKAQKVALSGLKVLGKIELPEPKKKIVEAPLEGENLPEAAEAPVPENNRPAFEKRKPVPFKKERREQREQRPAKNPIALAREREARAAEEKKREEEKRKKEQRTLNYQNRIKAAAPTKSARLINENDLIRLSDTDLKPEPKTWFGKFWRWFTT
jgi:hypothetical protein